MVWLGTSNKSVTSTIAIPGEVNVKIQICKFWGNLCTSYLLDQDVDICRFIENNNDDDGDDDVYCASAGIHDFQTSLTLSETSLSNTNFAVNGVTFRLYVLVNNDFTCHAQFTTVKLESSGNTMAVSIVGFVGIMLSIFVVHEVGKRRRRTVARADLLAEEQKAQEQTIEFCSVHNNYVTL